jgi:hypothetical protein
MKEKTMNRMTASAIYVALTASPGLFAHAQPVSMPDAKSHQMQRAVEPLMRCTHRDVGSRALQPCSVRQADEAVHLGSDITRQDFDCVLSGVCGMADRARVNG